MKFNLLFISIFFINQAVASQGEISGSISGEASVDQLGNFNYSIPLEIPTSIHNFIPKLSLNYNSQKQEGGLGIGWFIDGLSVISRCQGADNSLLHQKSISEIVDYEKNNSNKNAKQFELSDFCLDGKRLILVNGESVAQPEFRLENDEFFKVTLKTNVNGGVDKFIVTDKGGNIREYERKININEKNSGGVYVDKISSNAYSYIWGLTKVSDVNGNFWNIQYLDDKKTDILYPSHIKYTGNSNGVLPRNFIKFDYLERTNNEKIVNYVEGSKIIYDKKLYKISIGIDSIVNSEYNFDYDLSTAQDEKEISRLRLNYVNYCTITNNIKKCIQPTNFIWNSNTKDDISPPVIRSLANLDVPYSKFKKYLKLKSNNGSEIQNIFAFGQGDSQRDTIYIQEYMKYSPKQSISYYEKKTNSLKIIKRDLIKKFTEFEIQEKDLNNDGLKDILIYGRDSLGNVSFLEYLSSFDNAGNRQFLFHKEILNVFKIDTPLTKIFVVDGVDDLLLEYNNIDGNVIKYFLIKMDSSGGVLNVFSRSLNQDIIKNINNIKVNDIPVKYLIGKFDSNTLSGILIYSKKDSNNQEYICGFPIVNQDGYVNNDLISCSEIKLYNDNNLNIKDNYKNTEFLSVDYNSDGYDDIVRIFRRQEAVSNIKSASFLDEILPIFSMGNGEFEYQKLIKTKNYSVDISGLNETWRGDWFPTVFGDFNQDGLIDYYRLSNQGDTQFVGSLQEPNGNFNIYSTVINEWASRKAYEEKFQDYRAANMPGVLNLNLADKNSAKLSLVSSFGSDKLLIPSVNFDIFATNGGYGYLYSFDMNIVPLSRRNGLYYKYPKNLLEYIKHKGDKGFFTQVQYAITDSNEDNLSNDLFPIKSNNRALLVANSFASGWNGSDNQSAIAYSRNTFKFISPKMDVRNKRNLGFEKIIRYSESDNEFGSYNTINTYNQKYPFIGMTKSVISSNNYGLILKYNVDDNDFISDSAYSSKNINFPRIKRFTKENYISGKLVSTELHTENRENQFGNLTNSTSQVISVDKNENFSVEKKMDYYPSDISKWIPGLLKESSETVSRTNQTPIQKMIIFSQYDNRMNLLKKIENPDDISIKIQTDYTYDNYGNILSVAESGTGNKLDSDIGIRKFNYLYESGINHSEGVFNTKITNNLGHSEKFTYDAISGKVLSYTDPNGLIVKNTIDSLGRILTNITADNILTTNSYEACNSVLPLGSNSIDCEKGESIKIKIMISGNSPIWVFKNDINLTTRIITKAYDNINYIISRYEYFNNGVLRRYSESSFSNVPYSNLLWTNYEYDQYSQIKKIVAPGNRITTFDYNGLEKITTNSKGQKRKEISNIANEVVEIIDHDNNSLKYSRNAQGKITKTTDALDRNITLTFDKNGNKLQQVDPVLGTWNYRYNVLGQPVWQQDGKGQQTTFQYDSLGRLIKRVEPDLVSEWTWDTSTNGKGKLAKLSSTNGFVQNYNYDNFGRLYQTVTGKVIDPKAQSASDYDFINKWNYDIAGRVLAYAYPTGFGYRNIYDTNGYLKEVRNLAGNQLLWTANSRDAKGNVTQETLGNGLVTKRTFKADTGFLESINTGNATIQQNTYAFDSLGNLINRNQNLTGISNNEVFTYDNINRLKTVINQNGATSSVTYDAIGNITQKSGNETFNPTKPVTYSWTSFNMPLQIKQGSDSESFIYGPNHERVRRTSIENGKTSTTIYINPRIDTGGTFERTYQSDGTFKNTHYIYANGDVIGSFLTTDKGVAPTGDLGSAYQSGVAPNSTAAAINKSGPYRYFHNDHLSSIEAITDASGNIVERLSYDPWGKRRNDDGSVAQNSLKGVNSNRGFTSHEMLDNIGLVHMNGRLYDPVIGRFISPDPTIDGSDNLQGYNRYAYVHNNPGSLLDPDGYGFFSKLVREVSRPFKQLGKAFGDAIVKIDDDWLGNCSKGQGDCGGEIRVTFGSTSNNQTVAAPSISFSGKNNYGVTTYYQNGGLKFESFDVNGMSINSSFLKAFNQYIFSNVQGKAAINIGLDPYNNKEWQTGSDGAEYACDNNNCNMVSGRITPVTWDINFILNRLTSGLYGKFVKSIDYFSMAKSRNKPPSPAPEAQGRPHSIIERYGRDGQYTTHNGDGTWKQYRGSGQDHGNISRPNVKETQLNYAPNGQPFPGKPEVRKPYPDEFP